MPRRALSTLRVDIKEDDSSGSWMELSDSNSAVPAEFSAELLLMHNLRGSFTEKTMLVENINLDG
jgi:hypothetical protein